MRQTRSPASLIRNTFAQSAPLMLGYLFGLISAPVILSGLGIRQFGIWALTGGLAQYAALLNFGAGPAVSRFVAANQDDPDACGEYMAVGVISVTAVGAVLIAAATVAAAPLARAIHGITVTDMRAVLLSSACVLLASMLSTLAAAYPVGLRRMVAPNLGLVVGAVLNFVASVGSIALGGGLRDYAYANAGAGAVSALIVILFVLRVEDSIPFKWPRWRTMSRFLRFSGNTQLVGWADVINYQTDKVVIALAVGPSAAGAYELANRVATAARQVGVYSLSALLPTLSADLARSGMDSIRRRYRRLLTVTVSIGFPPLLLVAAMAPLLLRGWLSHVPRDAAAVLAALSIAYIANVSSGVSYVVGMAAGAPQTAARTAAGTAILNLALTAALAPVFGLWGVLAGTVVALSTGALAQVVLVHRKFSLSLLDYREAVLPTLAAGTLLAVPIAAISYSGIVTNRALAIGTVLVMLVAYVVTYLRFALRTGRVPETVARRFSAGLSAPSAP
jgi:O-antigen/teichoic acid export membrane protein